MVGLGRDICCYYNHLSQEMIPAFHYNNYSRDYQSLMAHAPKAANPSSFAASVCGIVLVLMQRFSLFLRLLCLPVFAEADTNDESEDAGSKEQDSEVIAGVGKITAWAGAAVTLAVAAMCATSAAAA